MFRAVGLAVWVNEEQQIDIIAAISGSGPAYIFLIVEALQQAAAQLGLPAELCNALAAQTCLGAARMVTESKQDVVQLRRSVTSPGGTTEQAIKVLETGDIRDLFVKALTAAVNRAKEITKTLDN
jgi:pyrroline-5-carboxylate reductase